MGLHTKFNMNMVVSTPYPDIAANAFQQAFMDKINELCPVRTGKLLNSIHCEVDAFGSVEVWADAEYAQYVEFGTWRQAGQSFFSQAMLAGCLAAAQAAEVSKQADRMFSNIGKQMNFGGSMGGFGDFLGEMMGAAATLAMLFPILLMGFGIADSIGLGDMFTDTFGSAGGFSLYELFGTNELSDITAADYMGVASNPDDWDGESYENMDFGLPQIEII